MRRFTLLLIMTVLILAIPGVAHGAPRSLTLLVEEQPYIAAGSLEMLDGEVMVPAKVLETAFGAQLNALEAGQYELVIENVRIQFAAGSKSITANGRPAELRHAPVLSRGRLMVPLELIAVYTPVMTSWDPVKGRLNLRHPLNEVTLLWAVTNSANRPVMVIETRREMGNYQLLKEQSTDDRIVIEFDDMQAAKGLSGLVEGNPFVRQIRFEPIVADRLRVIIELKRPVGYQFVTFPGMRNHLEIHFDFALKDMRVITEGGWPRVLIDTGGDTEFKTFTLSNPERIVIDLPGTVCTLSGTKQAGDGVMVTSVRTAQFEKRTSRVVIDLPEARGYRVTRVPGRKGLLQVLFPHRVTGVILSNGSLAVAGEGKLTGNVVTKFTIDGAELDLVIPNAVLKNAAVTAVGNLPQVKDTSFKQTEAGELAIHLTFLQFGGYRLIPEPTGALKLMLPLSAVAGKIIYLDPGHGGQDPGALSPGGLQEKNINLDVAQRVAARLMSAGAKVVLTRNDDTYVGLYDRPAMANQGAAEAYVSIHSNLHPTDKYINGIETYHCPGRPGSQKLALILHTELLRFSGLNDRGIRTREDFVVTRETTMPSVLIEMGFLSNPLEEQLLGTMSYHETMADAVFESLLEFFTPDPPANQ